ncbi:MAG: HAD-IC family P-type ATPase [Cystobacterineae bacterium]|nr:HAD-IC family P-type ATPase [Cystobacterineae bacterium]
MGCEAVYQILHTEELSLFYSLADGQIPPAAVPSKQLRSHTWLEPLLEKATQGEGLLCSMELDVQGIHCTACVWLLNELFRRQEGGRKIVVNPALGKVQLVWARGLFNIYAWIKSVERFGYQFGAPHKQPEGFSTGFFRLGVCISISMNVMLFSAAFYFGMSPADGMLFQVFTYLCMGLTSIVVFYGGWPFFHSALASLRTRLLHLDVPIALGIVLSYSVSVVQFSQGRGDIAYLDTLNIFVTLMLTGRWLRQRVLEKNKRFLLEDGGSEGFWVRVKTKEAIHLVRAPEIRKADTLLVAPGDVIPVNLSLLSGPAEVSTDWITGELEPQHLSQGDMAMAGSINAGKTALLGRALTDFADSPLVPLLRQVSPSKGGYSHLMFWNQLSRAWVVGVLVVASLGFLLWMGAGFDKAINVAVALLVVTCPCALGITIPLAYELTQSALKRHGFYIRSGDLLDRLTQVKKVLFDKTGTLTLGRLELKNPQKLWQMSAEARHVLYNLVSRSSHPVSMCIAAAFEGMDVGFDLNATVYEEPGKGVEWQRGEACWRLGRSSWAVPSSTQERTTVLSRNGEEVALLETAELLRADAAHEVEALRKQGVELWVISGDGLNRTSSLADRLGISHSHVLASQTPQQKAEAVERIDAMDSLYLGDGVNDSMAFEKAWCAGAVAIDRPVMPGKSDFFLVSAGVLGIGSALTSARALRRLTKKILGLSLVYNVAAVVVGLFGHMTPVWAAISMPISSLGLIFFCVFSLRGSQSKRAANGFWRAQEVQL